MTRVGRFLCRVGLHSWRHVFGARHWHVECRRCGARDVWTNFNAESGYHPISPDWKQP